MHADGVVPGKAYGEYETYVVEPVAQPGLIVALEVLTLLDEHTATLKALRTLSVSGMVIQEE